MRVIMPRKCAVCGRWWAESRMYDVHFDEQIFYVCETCVADADERRYGTDEHDRAEVLALETFADDEADDFDADDSGRVCLVGRFMLVEDFYGHTVEVRTFSSPEDAMRGLNGYRMDGFGADETDAYITFAPQGVEVSFNGEYIGTFETERRAKAMVSVLMRKHGYFPNVWRSYGSSGIRNISSEVW